MNRSAHKRKYSLLLVEDNEGDILLTKEAIEETGRNPHVHVVKDGQQAVEYMEECAESLDLVSPDLVILDINMPKKNGHEVLQWIRVESKFKHIPVILFTTSSNKTDIQLGYSRGCNCYIQKPVDINKFFDTISAILNFWMPKRNDIASA